MSKVKYLVGFAFGVLVIFLGAIALYCWLPSLFIGEEILENSITTVYNSTSAPKNYRASFAKWEYVVNDSTGKLDKVLVSNTQNQGLTEGNSLIDLGIITEDGSYGRHIKDVADYKSWLVSGDSNINANDEFILYLINMFQSHGTERQKTYNIGNLAIALAANLSNEGKPLYWEGTSKWESAESKHGDFYRDRDNIREVKKGEAWVPIASKVNGGWYTATEQQLTNLYNLGSNHVVYKYGLGCGSVQWTNSRCWGYIRRMYTEMSNDKLDMTDAESKKYCDTLYMIEDLDNYMEDYLHASNPYSTCIETLTGWTAAVYECPEASCAYHYDRDGYVQEWYTASGKKGTITSRADFYDGTITDFSEQHKWVSGGKGHSSVSESTRIRDAISFYDKYNNK